MHSVILDGPAAVAATAKNNTPGDPPDTSRGVKDKWCTVDGQVWILKRWRPFIHHHTNPKEKLLSNEKKKNEASLYKNKNKR